MTKFLLKVIPAEILIPPHKSASGPLLLCEMGLYKKRLLKL